VLFLIETDFITGESIRVDGGRHLSWGRRAGTCGRSSIWAASWSARTKGDPSRPCP